MTFPIEFAFSISAVDFHFSWCVRDVEGPLSVIFRHIIEIKSHLSICIIETKTHQPMDRAMFLVWVKTSNKIGENKRRSTFTERKKQILFLPPFSSHRNRERERTMRSLLSGQPQVFDLTVQCGLLVVDHLNGGGGDFVA